MTTETRDKRRVTMVPVTTMEEVPVLSERERAELRAGLEQARAQVAAGQAVDHDSQTFKDRLIGIFRAAKRRP
jgi:hypothetical protein